MSKKRDLNPRPQPWQGCALPIELFLHIVRPLRLELRTHTLKVYCANQLRQGRDCAPGRIRTYSARRRQIYSLFRLSNFGAWAKNERLSTLLRMGMQHHCVKTMQKVASVAARLRDKSNYPRRVTVCWLCVTVRSRTVTLRLHRRDKPVFCF